MVNDNLDTSSGLGDMAMLVGVGEEVAVGVELGEMEGCCWVKFALFM